MILRTPTSNEIALTLALSHRNGRGDRAVLSAPRMHCSFLPSPACGRGKGEGSESAPTIFRRRTLRRIIAQRRKNACCYFEPFRDAQDKLREKSFSLAFARDARLRVHLAFFSALARKAFQTLRSWRLGARLSETEQCAKRILRKPSCPSCLL
jgi:hypothetical protein